MAAARAMPPLADAHCHLQLSPLGGCNKEVLHRAREAGVGAVMVCATHPDDFDAVERIAGLHDTGSGSLTVLVSLGVHPYRAADVDPPPAPGSGAEASWVANIRDRIARSGGRIGIGECGLDRSPSGLARCALDAQVAVFEAQVALAAELALPLTVHCVRAVAHVATVLRRNAPLRAPVVLHSWAGKPGALDQLMALGCVPSFSGAVCNPAYLAARRSAAACPQDSMLAETDSPDQLPVCLRGSRDGEEGCGSRGTLLGSADMEGGVSNPAGKRETPVAAATFTTDGDASGSANEPCNVRVVIEHLAAIRNESPAALAAQLTRNFVAIYGELDKDGHLEHDLGTRSGADGAEAAIMPADAAPAEP